MDAAARPSVFISYSRKDGKWLDALTTMLAPVVRAGIASVWWDKKIKPSQVWRQEIDAALAAARLAILLVSPHFLASDFIQNEELPFLIDAAKRRDVKLLWVLVSPCLYEHSPLRDLQTAHDLTKPLSKLRGAARGEALASIGRAVVEALGPEEPDRESHPEGEGRAGRIWAGARSALPDPSARSSLQDDSPGVQGPALHNLPYPRLGDLFTGRQEELDTLAGGGTAAITQSAAISGLGGIGKTRLAVEYAWRSGNRYTASWFVRADSPENLRRNLAALAGPELLNLPEWEEQDENKTVAAVKRWLREHGGWLMILDNVDTPETAEAVLEVLPSLYKGRVLITSRLTAWPPEVRKQALEKLSQEEAVRFLLQRTEGGREPAADDSETAGHLAQRVDGLPLALEQAAAFIVRHRMRLADYLQAWEGERQRVLQWFDPHVMRYPASVAVTWQHTFQQLTPTAAALLRLTAFLAPDPIPVEIFEQSAEHVEAAVGLFCDESGKAPDGKPIREAVADLAGFSMVWQQDSRSFSVHRMVQEVLRSQIADVRMRAWIETALKILDITFPFNVENPTAWAVCDRLRPHATRITILTEQAGIDMPPNRLLSKLGGFLYAKGLYSAAEPLLRRTLVCAEAAFGVNHPAIADSSHNLGIILLKMGRLAEAESLIRRALDIQLATHGENHPSVAAGYSGLALVHFLTDRIVEAEELQRRALAIDEAVDADNTNHAVSRDLNGLARVLRATNRLGKAETLVRRALFCDEAVYGPDHVFVAHDLLHLASLLQEMHRRKEAEPLMKRAVAIYEKGLGSNAPQTLTAQAQLDHLLFLLAPPRACDIY
jgi:tetratricopeptide (TPR) repeat protein